MHPLIARLIDPAAALAVLEKEAQGLALDPDEAAFAAEARREPQLAASVRQAAGKKSASPEAQQRAIVLAVRAATARVLEDPELGPPARAALEALAAEGASEPEARALVAQAVLEEAFGYAEDPAHFDRAFLRETLESLPALARVDQAAVDGWLETWAKAGAPEGRPLRLATAEALLESAWGEGPQPITPEHLDDALERLEDTVASAELEAAAVQVVGLLEFLRQQGVVGPQRLERLTRLTKDASLPAEASAGEEADEDDEDDEDDEVPSA
jgi:hypothetical protein